MRIEGEIGIFLPLVKECLKLPEVEKEMAAHFCSGFRQVMAQLAIDFRVSTSRNGSE
jgi:hypothetical protein